MDKIKKIDLTGAKMKRQPAGDGNPSRGCLFGVLASLTLLLLAVAGGYILRSCTR